MKHPRRILREVIRDHLACTFPAARVRTGAVAEPNFDKPDTVAPLIDVLCAKDQARVRDRAQRSHNRLATLTIEVMCVEYLDANGQAVDPVDRAEDLVHEIENTLLVDLPGVIAKRDDLVVDLNETELGDTAVMWQREGTPFALVALEFRVTYVSKTDASSVLAAATPLTTVETKVDVAPADGSPETTAVAANLQTTP